MTRRQHHLAVGACIAVVVVALWYTQRTDPAAIWRRELAAAAQLLAGGDVAGAELSLQRAEAAADEPSMRAVALEQLARLALAQGALDAARIHAGDAIAALNVPGADSALLAASVSTLALIERRREDWVAAADAYQRAAALWREAAGPDDATVAQMLTGEGRMLLALDQVQPAARVLNQSLALQRRLAAAPGDLLGETLNSLGEAYRQAGRGGDAEVLYREAVEVFAAALGADHPSVAATLGNIAALRVTQGQYVNAETLFARVIDMQEAGLGAMHPALATTLDNYALLLERTGREAAAAAARERAAVIRSMHGGG